MTTVSRVLNNHPYVSDEKRNAVYQAMEKSNYERNINAVHLSKGKTYLIGVVVPFSNHPYFGLLVEGIASEALNHNYKLVLFQTNYEKNREVEALIMLKYKQIDALIICSRICGWELIEEYASYGRIVFNEDTREKPFSSTYIDHYKSFSDALSYLHQKGHRNIGYCLGRNTGANSAQREKAYKDFLREINQPYVPSFVFYDCFNFEDGEEVVHQLLKMTHKPTALLVSSDQVAAGILTVCNKEKMKIPDQLALMGFDNQPIAKMMQITTLVIPLKQIGINLFLQAIEQEQITFQEVEVKLFERDTV